LVGETQQTVSDWIADFTGFGRIAVFGKICNFEDDEWLGIGDKPAKAPFSNVWNCRWL
jgi:hypothetical protein